MVIAVSIIWAQNKCSVLFFEKGNTWIYHLLLVVAITAIYRPQSVYVYFCESVLVKTPLAENKKIRIIFIPFSVQSNQWWPFEKKNPEPGQRQIHPESESWCLFGTTWRKSRSLMWWQSAGSEESAAKTTNIKKLTQNFCQNNWK